MVKYADHWMLKYLNPVSELGGGFLTFAWVGKWPANVDPMDSVAALHVVQTSLEEIPDVEYLRTCAMQVSIE